MDAYYFTFQSMIQAQTAAAALQRHGYSAIFTRAPKKISVTGCGYAMQIRLSDIYSVLSVLQNSGLFPKKIFRSAVNGDVVEVFL